MNDDQQKKGQVIPTSVSSEGAIDFRINGDDDIGDVSEASLLYGHLHAQNSLPYQEVDAGVFYYNPSTGEYGFNLRLGDESSAGFQRIDINPYIKDYCKNYHKDLFLNCKGQYNLFGRHDHQDDDYPDNAGANAIPVLG